MSDEIMNVSQNGTFSAPKPDMEPVLGRADHRLDPKKRFTIPADWFERMGRPAKIYVMPSLSKRPCLEVFSPAEFDRRMAPFRQKALSDAGAASFTSRIGEHVDSVSVDTQNRVRVKDSHLAFAQIKREDVVLIGAGNRFEVWSIENRPKLDGAESESISRLADDAAKFSF